MIKVNLLPPEIKNEIEQTKSNAKSISYLARTLLLLSLVLFITSAAYFGLLYLVDQSSQSLKEDQTSIEQYGGLEEKAQKVAKRINTIKSINKQTNKWSGVVEEIQGIIPSGVYLTEIKMDGSSNIRDQLSGTATNKKAVAALRDAMENSPKFEYVDIEDSKTVDDNAGREVESFTLSFSLSKEALK